VGEHRINVVFMPGVEVTAQRIAEVRQARKRMCGEVRMVALLELPAEADMDLSTMNVDQYSEEGSVTGMVALAVLAGSITTESLARLYLAYYPPRYPIEVFTDRLAAEGWLNDRLIEAGLPLGSTAEQ
jgi:hypothetical protein